MTYRIIIELDTSAGNAQRVFVAIADWARAGKYLDIDITDLSPTVTLEDGQPDDNPLLDKLPAIPLPKFAAPRGLTRFNDVINNAVERAWRQEGEDTERRLHARAATDTHRARGGRVL